MVALIKMRVYRRGDEVLVAACDADLLGKSFKEGDLRIEVSSFYDGLKVHKDELVRHLRLATVANFVGEKVVGIAIEEGYVDKENIIMIDGVPHAQMVLI